MDVYDLAAKKLTAAQNGRLKPRNGVNWYNGVYYTTASRTIDVSRLYNSDYYRTHSHWKAYVFIPGSNYGIIIEENLWTYTIERPKN